MYFIFNSRINYFQMDYQFIYSFVLINDNAIAFSRSISDWNRTERLISDNGLVYHVIGRRFLEYTLVVLDLTQSLKLAGRVIMVPYWLINLDQFWRVQLDDIVELNVDHLVLVFQMLGPRSLVAH
jgi:hypothetical protein